MKKEQRNKRRWLRRVGGRKCGIERGLSYNKTELRRIIGIKYPP